MSTPSSAPAAPTPQTILRRSALAPLILALYRLLGCQRRWRIGRMLLALALRLEGGAVWSQTARDIMLQFHQVEVGAYSYGECFDPAVVPPNVTIGRYVSIASGVRFFPQNHPIDRLSTHPFFYDRRLGVVATDTIAPGKLTVEHDVWIGRNVIVTPGCKRIGIGAVIGAGAVVTKDVPDFAVVAGVPGKVVRFRFGPAQQASVLKSQWWLQPVECLASELQRFLQPVEDSRIETLFDACEREPH